MGATKEAVMATQKLTVVLKANRKWNEDQVTKGSPEI